MMASVSLASITAFTDDDDDYEKSEDINLNNENEFMLLNGDDTSDDDKCILLSHDLDHEIDERGMKQMIAKETQTSFIPSYCKRHRNTLIRSNSKDDALVQLRNRIKRSEDIINFLHLESMHDLSEEQIRTAQAKIMLRYMDEKVDPCVDFYSYSCGNWAKYNSIPSDKVAYDTFEILRESLDEALHNLLIAEDKKLQKREGRKRNRNKRSRRHEKNAEIKAKNLFKSCMNYDLIEKRGIEPLLELLESLGGWPLLDRKDWNDKNFDWLELTANLRKYNNDILIVQYISPDIQNSNQNIIHFDQTTLGLPSRDYYLKLVNEKYLNSYRTFMQKVIHLMGVDKYEAEDRADEIIEFETNLAKIMSAQEDRTNISVLYQKVTLEELQKELPGINWIKYLTIVQDRVIDRNEKVIMFAKAYMHKLVKLIDDSEPATVANYLLWRFVRHRINNLDNRFLEAKQTFYQECFGRETQPPRFKNCVTQVNSNMGNFL
jgi:predicted metalloendopeptidase